MEQVVEVHGGSNPSFEQLSNAGTAGSANTGGGGGGINAQPLTPLSGGAGGSGIVVITQAEIDFESASGVWDLRQVFRQVKEDDWV